MKQQEASPFNRPLLPAICIVLVSLTWIVFGQTLHHEFINYDDPIYIHENPHITSGLTRSGVVWAFNHAHGGNWHPLTSISHMLDCQVYGLNASGHHLTNLLLHMVAVVLLFLLLHQITGALWRSGFVAAVFAIHPLRAESVAWIAERKDVLSGALFMLTLLAYARYVSGERSLFRYLLVVFFFGLGLMSKPMLVSVPFVLLLLDYWPLCRFGSDSLGNNRSFGHRSTLRGLFYEKAPLLFLSLVSCLLTLRAQLPQMRSTTEVPLVLRVENAIVSCVRYLRQLIGPTDLAPFYPRAELPLLLVFTTAFLLVAISMFVVRFGRSHRYLITGWGWYLIMLLPVIGLVQVGAQAQADRYTYLPQIGIIVAITWGIADAAAGARWVHRVVAIGAIGIIVVLAWFGYNQTRYWRNSESLWLHTLAVTKNNPVAHNNLGEVWLASGRFEDAIREAQVALSISPESVTAHGNLGRALLKQGNSSAAIQEFRRALSHEPGNINAQFNLAAAFLKGDRVAEAVIEYQKALAIKPDSAQGHLDLGNAYMRAGRLAEAIAQFEIALQLQPRYADARNSLAAAFADRQQWVQAIRLWRETLRTDSENVAAQTGLAWALATVPDPALRNGAEALTISQHLSNTTSASNPLILRALAAAYAEVGRFAEAMETAQRGIALATSQNHSDLAAFLQDDLRHFQSAQPLRDDGQSSITR